MGHGKSVRMPSFRCYCTGAASGRDGDFLVFRCGIALGWAGVFSTTFTSGAGATGWVRTGPTTVSGRRTAPALENPLPGGVRRGRHHDDPRCGGRLHVRIDPPSSAGHQAHNGGRGRAPGNAAVHPPGGRPERAAPHEDATGCRGCMQSRFHAVGKTFGRG